MADFYVTFGQRYRTESHPADPRITPDVWIRVEAADEPQARQLAYRVLDIRWAFLYDHAEFSPASFLGGELGVIRQEIDEDGQPVVVMITTAAAEGTGGDQG